MEAHALATQPLNADSRWTFLAGADHTSAFRTLTGSPNVLEE